MTPAQDFLDKRRENPIRELLLSAGLYHSLRLPDGRRLDGVMSIEILEERVASFRLPDDLRGKRALDIGPWDGYFTFEMERRGASLTAIDYVDLDTFRALHAAMGSKAEYHRLDLYELDPAKHGVFDIVLCLGVLYHLKHPLLALEKVCAVTTDVCIVESWICNGEAWLAGARPPIPSIEFYERDELAGQLDNWCGPTVSAIEAMIRAAGFAFARVLTVTSRGARVAAHRKWRELPAETTTAPELVGLSCHAHRGRCFRSHKEEYIELWCRWTAAEPDINNVFPEVDGYGVAPLSSRTTEYGLLTSLRVPPGLTPGKHSARLKIGDSHWSAEQVFYVDLPDIRSELLIAAVQDGVTWTAGEVQWSGGGWLSIWLTGLSAEADPGNVSVHIGGVPHLPENVVAESGQINVKLRPIIGAGQWQVTVSHRGSTSQPFEIRVAGSPPPIKGLEALQC